MTGFANLWDKRRNNDYNYIDSVISEYFDMGGVGVNYYRYLGVHDQGEQDDFSQPSKAKNKRQGIRQIQDMFFQENRDRHYDTNPYEVKVVYNMNDAEFDVRQFGMFIQADTLYIYVHMLDIVKQIGRKPINGDVLEMVHMREDTYLEETDYAINKFYVVQDVNRASTGWDPTWRSHIFRLKIKPMTDSQEFNDILSIEDETSGLDLRKLISDFDARTELTNANLKQAIHNVPYRNFENYQLYVFDNTETGLDYPWIWCGDGIPPNGAKLAYKGKEFPSDAKTGDWFLHTGYSPNILFQNNGGNWIEREVDWRMKWESATRILHTYTNNANRTHIGNRCFNEKQPLYKALTPRGKN